MFPTINLRETGVNLYALSQLLQVPIDEIICGNRNAIRQEPIVIIENPRTRRWKFYMLKFVGGKKSEKSIVGN